MHSHVYYKLQVKISFLAICLFQAFINFISAAENIRPKLCQFYASNRELTPVFHFHLPTASNAKSITCMAALSESVNWYFFPHISCDFFFPKPENLYIFCVLKTKSISVSKSKFY